MKIERFVTGIIGTNCYLVINEETKQAVIIDPAACPSYLTEHIKKEGLTLEAVLLTHAHFDHIMGIDGFLKEADIPVYVHEADEEMMKDPELNMSVSYTSGYIFAGAHCLKDGQMLTLAGYEFTAIHTPGHTKGGCCYYVPCGGKNDGRSSKNVLFSGDTLFYNSVGRTDFPGGSAPELIRSIQEKLMGFSDDTCVYPGHGEETTIGYERMYNPFIRGR